MKTDKLDVAKALIAKAKLLNDPELLRMANELLDDVPPKGDEYACLDCGHTFFSVKTRKKCPKCKKNTCQKAETVVNSVSEPPRSEEFVAPTRRTDQSRVRYDENGQPDGTYTRGEEVKPNIKPVDEGLFKEDTERFTKKVISSVTPRRKPVKFVEATCSNPKCGKKEKVHPQHVVYREAYLCQKCIQRKSRV